MALPICTQNIQTRHTLGGAQQNHASLGLKQKTAPRIDDEDDDESVRDREIEKCSLN